VRKVTELKADLVTEIAELLQVEDPGLSTGSTEPKSILQKANEILGLGAPKQSTKPRLAQHIVECAGFPWRSTFESRGSTITREGLVAVRDALKFLLAQR
jgi:hypothetical protein